jgi:hypothetical protein
MKIINVSRAWNVCAVDYICDVSSHLSFLVCSATFLPTRSEDEVALAFYCVGTRIRNDFTSSRRLQPTADVAFSLPVPRCLLPPRTAVAFRYNYLP